MRKVIIVLIACLIWLSSCSVKEKYHDSFFEDFNRASSEYFEFHTGGKGAEFTRAFGVDSKLEQGTNVLSFKIDPEDSAGAGRGPEIVSKKFTHYGSYAARIKVPDARKIQPDIGAVVGYFTYHMNREHGLSEIDFEWLLANPEIIYVGTWTGPRDSLRRIGRTINLAKGLIYGTTTRVGHTGTRSNITGIQSQPDTIHTIAGYDASLRFYNYGFDWYPDRLRWWMIHPESADTVVLWDYSGSQLGIPQNPSLYRLNFWHTNNWPVETNPNSLERPTHPYEVEIDWMSYQSMEK